MLGIDLVFLLQAVGYIGFFLIIFAESGILLGFFLPGDSLLFTAGFLASQGYFNLAILVLLAFVGAVLGDSFGYTFGKQLGPKIFTREDSRLFHKHHLERARLFYKAHGPKTIVLARFLPAIRTFAPIVAGVGQMRYRTFVIYNILGALLWAVGLTIAGYFFGNIIPNADQYIIPVVVIIIVVSLMPAIIEVSTPHLCKIVRFIRHYLKEG